MSSLDDALSRMETSLAGLEASLAIPLLSPITPTVTPLLGALEAAILATERLNAKLDRATEVVRDVGSLVEEKGGAIQAGLRNIVESISDRVGAFSESFEHETVSSILGGIESSQARWRDASSLVADQVGDMPDTLHQAMGSALEDTAHEMRVRLEEEIQRSGRLAVERAIQALLQQVLDTLVTTQIGIAITGAIAPYLPAIASIRIALDAIQAALDLLRGGI